MSDKTPRIGELFDAWSLWRKPFLTRKNWFPDSASIREVTDAELERFLAERDRQVAERAWDEADDAILAGAVGGVEITASLANRWPRNPYRAARGEQK